METIRRFRAALGGAVLCAVIAWAGAASAHDPGQTAAAAPAGPVCTSQEGVSCSEMCAPYEAGVTTVAASKVKVYEMVESRQTSMVAGLPIDFKATCPPGTFALGGGYRFIAEGTTINIDELRVTSNFADNMDPSGWNGWKVTVTRKPGAGAVDNCLDVEVRALCVEGQ
ncbi:MAG TPA: hypothetical protein PKC29_15585 [Thermodesulfobacteriota bacterium]|nr:hypothetical protein [Thermodesulfobacteriota bacterium]